MADLNTEAVHTVLASINACWREGRPLSMSDYLHPEITMAFPGFKGPVHG